MRQGEARISEDFRGKARSRSPQAGSRTGLAHCRRRYPPGACASLPGRGASVSTRSRSRADRFATPIGLEASEDLPDFLRRGVVRGHVDAEGPGRIGLCLSQLPRNFVPIVGDYDHKPIRNAQLLAGVGRLRVALSFVIEFVGEVAVALLDGVRNGHGAGPGVDRCEQLSTYV